jgi:uncharacterized protein YlxW (UPF0749 family)
MSFGLGMFYNEVLGISVALRVKIYYTFGMKEKAQKKVKKETDFEIFARIALKNFEVLLTGQEEMRKGQEELRQGQVKLEQGQEGLRQEVSSLKEEQKEINRTVKSYEKKQAGMLLSLDETVHRSEFDRLARRVEVLEK